MISVYSLWKSGALDLPIKLGIIRSSILEYCRIHEEYLKYRGTGYNYTRAVSLTADKMCLTEEKVKHAVAQVI